MSTDELTNLIIATDFPVNADDATGNDRERAERKHGEGWRLARLWGGYPELEWTLAVFMDRINAFAGHDRAYFYEDLSDFDTARWLVRVGAALAHRGEPSYPSVGLGFDYFDSAYRVVDGRLTSDGPLRGRLDHQDPETALGS